MQITNEKINIIKEKCFERDSKIMEKNHLIKNLKKKVIKLTGKLQQYNYKLNEARIENSDIREQLNAALFIKLKQYPHQS